jgi:nucleoid DNA-binding protein
MPINAGRARSRRSTQETIGRAHAAAALPGFGTFEVRDRAAGNGRNPKTGEELQISASRVAAFKPGAAVKAAVSGAENKDQQR